MYPSTTSARPLFTICGRARSIPYSVRRFEYSSPSGELTYFGFWSGSSARAPNPCTRPRASRIGNTIRERNRS